MKKKNGGRNEMGLQVVVLMGGLGTRLGLGDIPKSMADVHGKPFFAYELDLLRRFGFHRFLFLIGHEGDRIQDYFGDGTQLGISIDYMRDGERLLGTGGALVNAAEKLDEEFMLLYGDSFMDIDYRRMYYRYLSNEDGAALMAVYPNAGKYDRSNVLYLDGKLQLYDKRNPLQEMTHIDYGISILKKEMVRECDYDAAFDLGDVLTDLSKAGKLAGYEVKRRFYEIGSPQSLEEFRTYAGWRFGRYHRAVFFDRDGVIDEIVWNDDIEQLDSPLCINDFRYREGVIEMLRHVAEKGYLIFVITNQPAAAKGKTEMEVLYKINDWMMDDLKSKGIHVEGVYMCPHHPNGDGCERYPFLIRECSCRKPRPGLIEEVISVYNINIKESFMIGDSITDILAGKACGLKTIFVGGIKCDACKKLGKAEPDYVVKNIREIEGRI